MNAGTPEEIRRGVRRRTKGENGRTEFKKKIGKKGKWKTFSEYSSVTGKLQNIKRNFKIKIYMRR
jgi:hypothetical protein